LSAPPPRAARITVAAPVGELPEEGGRPNSPSNRAAVAPPDPPLRAAAAAGEASIMAEKET
jgi:hypothetical protein